MPDFELNVVVKNVSRSDMQFIIDQMSQAIELCSGKLEMKKYLQLIKLEKREQTDG